jgi:hypothetical protein
MSTRTIGIAGKVPTIIGFGHVNRVGKSTAAGFAKELILSSNIARDVIIQPLALPLKRMACYLYSWAGVREASYYEKYPDEKSKIIPQLNMTYRELLLRLGTVAVRGCVFKDTFVKYTIDQVIYWNEIFRERPSSDFEGGRNSVVRTTIFIIPDIRFENEIKFIREAGGICVEITRPGCEAKDIAETPLAGSMLWNHTIVNSGSLDDLKQMVKNVLVASDIIAE